MKAFTVKWHPERDITTIEYTVDFVDADAIAQADILKDVLFELEDKYNKAIGKICTENETTNQELLDRAREAYRLAEEVLERKKQVLDRWALREAVGDEGIASLELTTRSRNCLNAEGISTLAQLLEYTISKLRVTPNLGDKSLKEIIGKLKARGLKLKEKNA